MDAPTCSAATGETSLVADESKMNIKAKSMAFGVLHASPAEGAMMDSRRGTRRYQHKVEAWATFS